MFPYINEAAYDHQCSYDTKDYSETQEENIDLPSFFKGNFFDHLHHGLTKTV